jgi:hypothetical protein
VKRRAFVTATAAAGLSTAAPADEAPKNSIYHLVYYYLRTGPQVERTNQYLKDVYLPAARRAGVGTCGFFSPIIGERSPFVLSLTTHSSMAAMETTRARLASDKEFEKGWDAYNNIAEPSYVRMESSLLRAFDSMPGLEVPPGDAKRAARVFELRTYESLNEKASRRKIQMFGDGEIAIFRKVGMATVFFAETLVGRNLPSLTYMVGFDDLASRERIWRDFGADPAWQKLRAQPGLSDAEIVSNITNAILRPLPFSPIR